MKRLLYLFLCSLLLWQCNPDDDLNVVVRMEYPNERFEIPAGVDQFSSFFTGANNVPTNSSFFFQSVDENELATIAPGYARIRSLEGGRVSFGFIFEIVVLLCDEPVSAATRTEVRQKCKREAFYRQPVPPDSENVLNLIPNPNVNLKELLLQDRFSYVVELRQMRGTSAQFIECQLEMGFEAKR